MKTTLQVSLFLLLSIFGMAQHKAALNVNAFEKAIQGKPVQLLDVRTPDEFKEGYIKGAINADWQNQQQFAGSIQQLDKAAPVYLYCLSGIRSGKAADWLLANGFKDVINLEGGMKAWKAADKKVEIK